MIPKSGNRFSDKIMRLVRRLQIAWRAGRSVGGRRKPFSTATGRVARGKPKRRSMARSRSGAVRVVPERLGKRVAQIGARDADIGQHVAVEAGKHGGLAPGLAGARGTVTPERHQR